MRGLGVGRGGGGPASGPPDEAAVDQRACTCHGGGDAALEKITTVLLVRSCVFVVHCSSRGPVIGRWGTQP